MRGIYDEAWDPSSTPAPYHDAATFLKPAEQEAGPVGATDASFAMAAAMRVLRRHVWAGEADDVLAILPRPMRELLES